MHGFVGRAELASAVRASTHHVMLTHVEEWLRPVPRADVLGRLNTSMGARADSDPGVLRITHTDCQTAVARAD